MSDDSASADRGGDPAGTDAGTSDLVPLGLTQEEQADLVAFLRAL